MLEWRCRTNNFEVLARLCIVRACMTVGMVPKAAVAIQL
jgi:hypothetical protein